MKAGRKQKKVIMKEKFLRGHSNTKGSQFSFNSIFMKTIVWPIAFLLFFGLNMLFRQTFRGNLTIPYDFNLKKIKKKRFQPKNCQRLRKRLKSTNGWIWITLNVLR